MLDVDESLSEYYNLKKKYISSHYNKYIGPIVISQNSKLQKRRKFQELKKPLCINCLQPVGTIFERKYYENYGEKEDVIVFTAKCGNILNPCDLNIEIHKSHRESYDKIIQKANKKLNDVQLKIIKLKNKMLFLGKGNNNEAEYIKEFNIYKDDIIYYTELIGSYVEENIMETDNPEDKERLINLIASLNQLEIIKFKEYIQEYNITNDDTILDRAVNMYVNEILPKITEIRNLKYDINYVERDENKNYILVQTKNEFIIEDKNVDEVVKFITGAKLEKNKKKIKISKKKSKVVSTSNAKSKTLKTTDKTSKTKTLKKKLTISSSDSKSENPEDIVELNDEEIKSPDTKIINNKSIFNSDDDEDEIEIITEIKKTTQNNQSQQQLKVPKKINKRIILNEATEATN